MKLQYIILPCFLTAFFATANNVGDDLSKEITVEKEIVPEQRAATRLNVSPKVVLPAVTAKRLSYSEHGVTAQVPPSIAVLEPAACKDSLPAEKYRGYIDLGYFPLFNAGLSAGYRLVDNGRTCLNLWTQYDGAVYDGDDSDGREVTMRSHDVAVGAGLKYMVGNRSYITAGLGYSYSRFNRPVAGEYDYCNESANRVDAAASWSSVVRGLDYTLGLKYGYFGYGKPDVRQSDMLKPARENRFALSGDASMPVGASSYACLALDISGLGYRDSDYNTTLVSLTPSYLYRKESLTARVGAKVEFTGNNDESFHIAPVVGVDWVTSPVFALYCRLGGGEHQNTLGSLFGFTRYADYTRAGIFGNSNIPVTIDAGLDIGAWKGLSVELFGSYAVANDWLMPFDNQYECCAFTPVDYKGWRIGATVSYVYRDLAELKVSYETAPQEYDKGYYLWRDRARYVAGVSVSVHPVDRVDVTVGYELRAKRKILSGIDDWLSLGNMESLDVGALYRVNEKLSVFARLENLLDNKCMIFRDVPSQGFTGLVGFGYRF